LSFAIGEGGEKAPYAILARTMNVLNALKHRAFALLWAGQTTSRLGDSLHRIALAWWVLEKTGSAAGPCQRWYYLVNCAHHRR
jgi:hypothetical protein